MQLSRKPHSAPVENTARPTRLEGLAAFSRMQGPLDSVSGLIQAAKVNDKVRLRLDELSISDLSVAFVARGINVTAEPVWGVAETSYLRVSSTISATEAGFETSACISQWSRPPSTEITFALNA